MKHTVLIITATLLVVLGYLTPAKAEELSPIEITNSICKKNYYGKAAFTRTEEFEDGPSWVVEYKNGKLILTWNDFWANCAPERFESVLVIDGNKLTFSVDEVLGETAATCVCPYDVTSTFDSIEPGTYLLEFKGNMSVKSCCVEVDLTEGYNNSFTFGELASVDETIDSDTSLYVSNNTAMARYAGKFSLEVLDTSGIMEYSLEAVDRAELSLDGLRRGIYILRLTPAYGQILSMPIVR